MMASVEYDFSFMYLETIFSNANGNVPGAKVKLIISLARCALQNSF